MASTSKALVISACLMLFTQAMLVNAGGNDALSALLAVGLLHVLLNKGHHGHKGGIGHSGGLGHIGGIGHHHIKLPGGYGHKIGIQNLDYGHGLVSGGYGHGLGALSGGIGHSHGLGALSGGIGHSHAALSGGYGHSLGALSGGLNHGHGSLTYGHDFPEILAHDLGLDLEGLSHDNGYEGLSNSHGLLSEGAELNHGLGLSSDQLGKDYEFYSIGKESLEKLAKNYDLGSDFLDDKSSLHIHS